MPHMTAKKVRQALAYLDGELAKPDLTDARRDQLAHQRDLYARLQRSDTCKVCGRPLTDPESIAAGIGADCRKKVAA